MDVELAARGDGLLVEFVSKTARTGSGRVMLENQNLQLGFGERAKTGEMKFSTFPSFC